MSDALGLHLSLSNKGGSLYGLVAPLLVCVLSFLAEPFPSAWDDSHFSLTSPVLVEDITPADTLSPADLQAALEAWKEGRQSEAHRRLKELWRTDPSAYFPGIGSVAYWQGRVLEETEGAAEALEVWQVGLTALGMAGRFDPRLNDAYVRTVIENEEEGRYEQASGAYLDLLEQADRVPDADREGRRLIDRHVAQMAFLLREGVRDRFLRETEQERAVVPTYELRPGRGPALAAWWRGRDPVPGTGRNERIEEHLRRVLTAESQYGYDRLRRGFDDRGEIFVRLGPPTETRDVKLNHLRRHRFPAAPIKAIESGVPKHEIWFYPEYGGEAVYIFVSRQGRYRLSGPEKLLPPDVRGPYDEAERGEAKLAVLAMESILEELQVNSNYRRLYDEIWNYANRTDQDEVVVDRGDDQPDNTREAQRALPSTVAQRMQLDAITTREDVARIRRSAVPQQKTEVGAELEPVPVQMRRARFLDTDGSTRTLLYWTHPSEELDGKSLFEVTAVQQEEAYVGSREQSRRYVKSAGREGLEAWALPVEGAYGTYHLHLQFDQYEVGGTVTSQEVRRGEQVGRSVVRLDSLEALEAEGLRMSDLLPGISPEPDDLTPVESGPQGMALSPYPFGTIDASLELILYFEVYGLAYGPDDRTRMQVAYEVERSEEGGVFELFRDEEEHTRMQTEREGPSRKMQEYIRLDLGDLEEADEVRISVQATDQVRGQSVERSLTFDVASH